MDRVVGGIVVGVIVKILELTSCVVEGRYRNPLFFLISLLLLTDIGWPITAHTALGTLSMGCSVHGSQ